MFFWLIAAAIIGIALWYYLVKPLSHWSDMGVPQAKPWILLGDSWTLLLRKMDICEFAQWIYNLAPTARYVGVYNFTSPGLVLRDPDLIRQVGVRDFDSFPEHPPFIHPDADPMWSKSLVALTGERWREMRTVLSPTFTASKIKSMFELMIETTENFVNFFQEKNDDVIDVELKDAYSRFANDIIATTAFGVKVDSLKENNNTFYVMGKNLTDISGGVIKSLKFISLKVFPNFFKYLGVHLLDPLASKFFSDVVADTIKAREERNIVRPDIINALLEARKEQSNEDEGSDQQMINKKPKHVVQISNADITSQAVIFFFAGFDTVSTAMCFGSYELAFNKDVQDKLRAEIVETAKKGKITYDTLLGMRYLDMVISEMLRKWPPSPILDRLCTENYVLEPANENHKEVTIQKGHAVWFPIFAIHRDPKYHPDPDKFDPERFSDENKSSIVPYTYMPFGVGPRQCIGTRFGLIEIKALFFHLLLNYEIVTTKKTPIPLVLKKDLLPSIEEGFHLGFKRIKA